ncbi:hypothetical protein GF337_15830 [candidate division KSB1 bacterium]|nr:hypothetical protein [candidate division KSB1 bacterium]
MKKTISVGLIVIILSMMLGCAAHVHKVGQGAEYSDVVENRQWYILWGLVPLNEVDTQAMAEGATDYEIKTEQSALDIIMNIFTGMITVYSRTVTVSK